MRVTGSMLSSSMLSNLYSNLKNLNKYQNQLSTNSRILRLSDDPIGVISAIQIGKDLSKNTQYEKNVADAKGWLDESESVLSEMNNVLLQAKELSVSAGNGTYSDEQKIAIAQEIEGLRDHFTDLANTKYSGKYIFGGYNTTQKPFSKTGTTISYNSISDLGSATPAEIAYESSQVKKFKISESISFDVSISGTDVMGTGADNIYSTFQGFLDSLTNAASTAEDIAQYSSKFTDAQERILALVTEVGGRQTRLDMVTERYENQELSLNELLNKTAGIDKAEVITKYKDAENAYNTALQVGARIIQPSLADFLK